MNRARREIDFCTERDDDLLTVDVMVSLRGERRSLGGLKISAASERVP